MTNTILSVNLNKVALLRNQRDVGYPDVVTFARIAIAAGARGITVHPRPDERHIRRSDVLALASMIHEEFGGEIEFNVEGNPTEDFLVLVEKVKAHQVTLVPDDPAQATSDHGWPLPEQTEFLTPIVERLHGWGTRVALFIDDDVSVAEAVSATGADRVELYTGPYFEAYEAGKAETSLKSFADAARAAYDAGLGINAGHDLNLDNLADFIAAVPNVAEVSIGHGLIADALTLGMDAAVKAYIREIEVGHSRRAEAV